ncbi:RcpC/CpaB family pilus assembly protein [Actinoplanes sp. G11-F43]|uniref:RcpC/CpaB family pilus assembly protein n=1 Tax=Actinoplanes sp. G11-F43 TaxID=3424130 RepID=UPI003D329BDF
MRRRVLILLAALLLAFVSGAAIIAYVRGADKRAVEGKQGVWVLIARERIPADTVGSDVKNLTERILVPNETVPVGALTTWEAALDGLRLTAPLEKSQLLMRALFQKDGPAASGPRRYTVPTDMLAVTVALSVAPQVAGDVTAGDQVTVYGTCPLQPDSDSPGPPKTRPLLPRAQVMVIGEAPEVDPTTPAPVVPSGSATPEPEETEDDKQKSGKYERYVVSLAVTPKDAQRLIHASKYCGLYLALLGATVKVTPGDGVDTKGLF